MKPFPRRSAHAIRARGWWINDHQPMPRSFAWLVLVAIMVLVFIVMIGQKGSKSNQDAPQLRHNEVHGIRPMGNPEQRPVRIIEA